MANWHNSPEWAKARAYAKTMLEPVCQYCGKDLEGNDWTIDHIVPAGSDGEPDHNLENLQSLCRECNGRKSDRVLTRAPWTNHKR